MNAEDKKVYHGYPLESSGIGAKGSLPPINKTKNSNNIDISEFVRTVPENPPLPVSSFRSRTLPKHTDNEGITASNPVISGHKPLPNVGETSDNSKESVVDGKRDFSSATADSRLGSVRRCRSKGDQSTGRKIAPLKERKTSVERLRSGLLVSGRSSLEE